MYKEVHFQKHLVTMMPTLLAGPIQPILEVHDLKLTVAPKPESRDLKLMKYLN